MVGVSKQIKRLRIMRKINLLIILLLVSPLLSKDVKRKIKIKDRYLNFPVSASEERKVMTIEVGGEKLREFFIRLSDGDPDYWVFYDMSNINSKNYDFIKKNIGSFNNEKLSF